MGNLESRGHLDSFNLTSLAIDQAYLSVKPNPPKVSVFSLSSDCIQCSPIKIKDDFPVKVSTKFDKTFFVTKPSSDIYDPNLEICRVEEPVGEFGVYQIQVQNNSCQWKILKEPVNIYWPILICLAFYFLLGILWLVGVFVYKKLKKQNQQTEEAEENGDRTALTSTRQRIKSLDTFRGIAIVIMIFVNNGGGKYFFFEHAPWDGLYVADLVFPWFLWIMGVCIPISIRSMLKRTTPIKSFGRIVKRSCYLFLLGLMLNAGIEIKNLRIFGVLQRFSLTYLTVASLCLVFAKFFDKDFNVKRKRLFQDIIRLFPHWLFIIFIIIVHCLITFLMPVPGCPTGYLGPGGIHLNSSFPTCTGGSTGYVDRTVLSLNHLYAKPTIQETYLVMMPYDPEGIVGTLTSCVQVFLGVQAGSTLLTYPTPGARVSRWLTWGAITGVLGTILCKGSLSDGWIPVNKNLWSLSFVLVTSSFAFILLSLCYLLVDVKKKWSGSPFYYPGMNAILLYCGHMLTTNTFPFVWAISNMETHLTQLIINLWTTSVWVLISVWLYRIKFFLAL